MSKTEYLKGKGTPTRDQIHHDILVPWNKFHRCTLSSGT